MADPVDVWFGMKTRVGPRNHVLGGGVYHPMGRGKFWGVIFPHSDALQQRDLQTRYIKCTIYTYKQLLASTVWT